MTKTPVPSGFELLDATDCPASTSTNRALALYLGNSLSAQSASMGGNHRSRQLIEWFSQSFRLIIPGPELSAPVGRLGNLAAGVRYGVARPACWIQHPTSIGRGGQSVRWVKRICQALPSPTLIFWESVSRGVVGGLLRAAGHRVVALPQHMRSLDSPGGVTEELDVNDVIGEMNSLRSTNLTLTISSEEAWLMRHHGINAHWAPYYPPTVVSSRMERIRQRRRTQPDGPILLIGSAVFPPNAAALRWTIETIAQSAPSLAPRCVVVGNGTERLSQEATAVGMKCLGRLDDDAFDRVLQTATAAIIFQQRGSGALTRIPELLLAGVPVIVNDHAGRSAHHLTGLWHCNDPERLIELTERLQDTPPPPQRPNAWLDSAMLQVRTIAPKP